MWIRRVGAEVQNVAYSADGRTVYTVEGGRVSAWDIASREPARLFRTAQLAKPLYVFGLYPVGNRYLLLGIYAHWAVWDIEAKKELTKIKLGRYCQPVGSDSTAVRFVSSNGKLIRECDLATGKTTTAHRAPDTVKKFDTFAYSPDGQFALVLNEDGALVALATGKAVSVKRPPGYQTYALQFAANGDIVWAVGDYVYVCKTAKPNEPIAAHPWSFVLFALNPRLPIYAALNEKRQFTLYSLETGEALRTFDLELGRSVRCACFSPDGLTCAVGGSNKQFAVFDVDV